MNTIQTVNSKFFQSIKLVESTNGFIKKQIPQYLILAWYIGWVYIHRYRYSLQIYSFADINYLRKWCSYLCAKPLIKIRRLWYVSKYFIFCLDDNFFSLPFSNKCYTIVNPGNKYERKDIALKKRQILANNSLRCNFKFKFLKKEMKETQLLRKLQCQLWSQL